MWALRGRPCGPRCGGLWRCGRAESSTGLVAEAFASLSNPLRPGDKFEAVRKTFGVDRPPTLGEAEALRLAADLSLAQTVKLMGELATKRRRSTPLLRALSENARKGSDPVEPKRCADLLFALASLNYPEVPLLRRLCGDLRLALDKDEPVPSSILGSAVTSLRLLRYRDVETLDSVARRFLSRRDSTRPKDAVALVSACASLAHAAPGLDDLSDLSQESFERAAVRLEYVWSLCALGKAKPEQLEAVLSEDFIVSLRDDGDVPFAASKRLRNVDAYARSFFGRPAVRNADDAYGPLRLSYSKEKRRFVDVLLDTLKSLLASDSNLKRNCDSKMGFLYDAHMVLDKNCNPYPVDTSDDRIGKSLVRVAFIALEYHDLCINTGEPLGAIVLYKNLLEKNGFKVLLVPHTEFNVSEKLMYRVQYIEKKLKNLVKDCMNVENKFSENN